MIFLDKLKLVFQDKGLKGKLIFVAGALIISRILATIPIPGVNPSRLASFFAGSDFFGFLDVFSGGGMSNLSIVMLGVGPYITASIIMQVLTIVSPKLKTMYQEDGQIGRAKFSQISRLITIPIAFIQGLSFLLILEKAGVVSHLGPIDMVVNIIVITAGSILLMWIGELITEFGIGNGISLLIFAGIVAQLPTTLTQVSQSFITSDIPVYLLFFALSLFVIYAIVFISEAERPVPVTYAKRTIGSRTTGGISTYLPLRVNQAGVIPIIFAMSMLLFPQMILKFLSEILTQDTLRNIVISLNDFISNNFVYGAIYFILVFAFTYFYTAVTFDPDQISKNLQQSGAFVPGVRPGTSTSDYISKVLTRITLVGALFLGVVAVLPLVVKGITGITSIAVGGTALLIVVSVVIDLVKKIEAQITMREY